MPGFQELLVIQLDHCLLAQAVTKLIKYMLTKVMGEVFSCTKNWKFQNTHFGAGFCNNINK